VLRDLSDAIGRMVDGSIRTWVGLTGKRLARSDHAWLECPMGSRGRIGREFYSQLANTRGLTLLDGVDHGLLPDFGVLRGSGFDPDQVRTEIRDFYEHTSAYDLVVWSEAPVATRFFLWALTKFVSRRMDQLNIPVSSLELAGGMTNDILPMVNGSGERVFTGWLRRRTSDEVVVYAGLYTTARPPAHSDPCVKVSFPVPRGSATVFLHPEVMPDGSFKLTSSGSGFGGPGFYRMVESGEDHWRVRYIRTLREHFHVYVDGQGALRTDHKIRFLGLTVFRMHYKLNRVQRASEAGSRNASKSPSSNAVGPEC
jgi:hypothetical protein